MLKQDLKSVFSSVIKNMGSTLGACGDVNRNVLAPPVRGCFDSLELLTSGLLDIVNANQVNVILCIVWPHVRSLLYASIRMCFVLCVVGTSCRRAHFDDFLYKHCAHECR